MVRIGTVRSGVLVLTGTTGNFRYNEYIFPHPTDNAQKLRLTIGNELFTAVDGGDQITAWQEKAFPENDRRPEEGRLACGDPVWYETDPDDPTTVTSFGRSGGYRVPYNNKLGDLLPKGLRWTADPLDVCQGLFGEVFGMTAIRRRITVGHAVLLDPPSRLAASELNPIRVGLLAPNRQSYALHLTQPDPNKVLNLRDFDGDMSGGVAEPRGFKLYPHRQGDENPPALPHLEPTLHLLDPAARYTGNTDGFERVDDLAPYLATWDKIAVRHAQAHGEDMVDGTGWQRVDRLRELALATSWRGRLKPASLAQMGDVKEFAQDRVLPGLLHLFGMA